MKQALDKFIPNNIDNPFLINGNKKMIMNLKKIIPRSLSEEKTRIRNRQPQQFRKQIKNEY